MRLRDLFGIGQPAEIDRPQIGIETDWHLIQGTPAFFGCTKKLHNMLQGAEIDFPEVDREAKIILTRLPDVDTSLALQIARMVAAIRKEDLRKVPGVAETLDWAAALVGLDVGNLHDAPEAVFETMMCLLKTHEDKSRMTREVTARLLGRVA